MVVVDASAAVTACLAADGFEVLSGEHLIAPPLLWPECRSVLHVGVVRGQTSREAAERAARILETAPVESQNPPELGSEAWSIADELGWSKMYDAEYVALARIRGCGLLTLDTRLRRGAEQLGIAAFERER